MPFPRLALYSQGETLHVAIWPGAVHNTHKITRFIAAEGRSYVLSVSATFRKEDVPTTFPHYDLFVNSLRTNEKGFVVNGGSCIAGPDGKWVIPPVVDEEKLIIATLDHNRVLEERQNFDPVGHYSRPDVFKMTYNTERQAIVVKAKL